MRSTGRQGGRDVRRLYTKRELADVQFDGAIALFLDSRDYLSALTLAGAAEELYGGLFEAADLTNATPKRAIDIYREALQRVGLHYNEKFTNAQAIAELNRERDALKHFRDGAAVELDAAECAEEMIERAHFNRYQLTGDFHSRIAEFDTACRALSKERQREMGAPTVDDPPHVG